MAGGKQRVGKYRVKADVGTQKARAHACARAAAAAGGESRQERRGGTHSTELRIAHMHCTMSTVDQ